MAIRIVGNYGAPLAAGIETAGSALSQALFHAAAERRRQATLQQVPGAFRSIAGAYNPQSGLSGLLQNPAAGPAFQNLLAAGIDPTGVTRSIQADEESRERLKQERAQREREQTAREMGLSGLDELGTGYAAKNEQQLMTGLFKVYRANAMLGRGVDPTTMLGLLHTEEERRAQAEIGAYIGQHADALTRQEGSSVDGLRALVAKSPAASRQLAQGIVDQTVNTARWKFSVEGNVYDAYRTLRTANPDADPLLAWTAAKQSNVQQWGGQVEQVKPPPEVASVLKAEEKGLVAGSEKRAGLAPDIVTAETQAAADKAAKVERAKLSPDIVAGEASKAGKKKAAELAADPLGQRVREMKLRLDDLQAKIHVSTLETKDRDEALKEISTLNHEISNLLLDPLLREESDTTKLNAQGKLRIQQAQAQLDRLNARLRGTPAPVEKDRSGLLGAPLRTPAAPAAPAPRPTTTLSPTTAPPPAHPKASAFSTASPEARRAAVIGVVNALFPGRTWPQLDPAEKQQVLERLQAEP